MLHLECLMQIPLILTENNFQTPFLFGPPSPQLSVGHWPVSLLKMSPFGRYISNILPVRISFLPSFSISCKLGVNGLKKLLSQIYWNIENILNTLKYIEMRHLSIKTSPLQFLLQINPLETFVLGRLLSSYILFNWVKIRTSWGASHPSALMNNCLN